ncbi:MAG: hypothetical protein GY862_23855 [Gammaproteobacteria bacterium]|nr:hypothetical protein [Gammaproteobacteria bacterium]
MQETGSEAGLRFQFEWQAKKPARCKTAARATWGKCLLWLGDELVWGEPESPVEWDWVQLLEFLAGAWNWLVYEETYPIQIAPNTPGKIWMEAGRRWEQMADDSALEEQTALYEFESVYNLAKGLAGIHLPPLFLLRQGRNFWIETQETSVLRPAAETLDTLKHVGNLLHARLQWSGGSGQPGGAL